MQQKMKVTVQVHNIMYVVTTCKLYLKLRVL